jgi:hypothetical protein
VTWRDRGSITSLEDGGFWEFPFLCGWLVPESDLGSCCCCDFTSFDIPCTVYTKTDHQKNIPSGFRNRETLNSTDELINGIHDKVTRYILSKIDIEIDRLCEKGWSDKNESESKQQEFSQEQDLQPPNNDPHGLQFKVTILRLSEYRGW